MMRILLVLLIAFPLVATAEPRKKRKRMVRTEDVAETVTGSIAFTPERPQDPVTAGTPRTPGPLPRYVPDRHTAGDREPLGEDVGPYAPPFAGRNVRTFPYGDGSTYYGTPYLSRGYHDFHTPDGFIGRGAMHYGSGYSSNRINW